MDYIFNRLTDIGLRRIYKFILKRTIGKYLQNELLIEQLEVQSRDGIVRLYDLELNADLLNEEVFNKTPVRAKVLKVNQIEVFLSYTSMLTESCTFTIDTLDIILEPNDTWQPDSSSPVKTTSSSNEANANTRSPERTEEDLSEEGHQGLSFIANWIEVIIAKLKASVNHVNIYLETKSGPSLQLSLHHISYLNNDPQVFGAGQSTMELSTRMMSGVDPTASLLLGSTKIVKVATIDVIIHHEEKDIMLLQVTNSSQVRVKLDAGMSVTSVHGIDVDVMIPFFSINLEKESCLALASIIEEYSTTPRAQSPSRPTHLDTSSFVQDILERHNNPSAFLNKYEQELRSNLDKNSASNRSTLGDELNIEDGDLLKILSIMKQQKNKIGSSSMLASSSMKASSNLFSFQMEDEDVVVSDVEEGSSVVSEMEVEEEESDSEFFDAMEGKPITFKKVGESSLMKSGFKSRRMQGSSMMMSTMGVDKSTFVSAIQGSHIKETTNKESYIRLRVSVSSFRLVVSKEEDKSQLVASIEDTVVSYSNIQNDETDLPNSDKIPSTGKVSITMSEIKLKEFYQNSEKTLLSFHNPVDSKSIFSSPNLEIDVDFRGLGIDSEIHVKMNFQPILLSFGSLSVANWIETIVGMIPTKSEASPSTNFSLEISIPEINCFVLSDHRIPLDWWKELRKALRLQSNPSVWKEFATKYRQIFLTQLVGQSGGLHFNFQDLNICFSTMEDKYVHKEDNHLLAIEQVSMGLFIRDDQGKMLKTDLIKASSNKEQTEKVTVKRYEIDFSNNSIYNSQLSTSIFGDASKGIIEDMGPKPPKVEGKNMIHINAYRLELDIQQREYNALMLLADTIAYSDPNDEDVEVESERNQQVKIQKDASTASASFGFIISTTQALLCLSENEFSLWEHHAEGGVNVNGVLEELCAIFSRGRRQKKAVDLTEPQDVLKLCVSIRKPEFQLFSAKNQLFVGLKANDLSIFEMTPTDYKKLCRDNFDFHHPPRLSSRVGPHKHKMPTVHRAYVLKESTRHELETSNVDLAHLSDHTQYGHAFEVRLLLTHDNDRLEDFNAIKSVHFFIDFYDIVINHDPSSTWLLKLVKILTPQTIQQMMEANIDDMLDFVDQLKSNLSENDQKRLEEIRVSQYEEYSSSVAAMNVEPSTQTNKVKLPPFEITRISVRVRDSLIDYSSVANRSRTLLSVGLIAISSTIVSNSTRFTLKISLSRLGFYVSNYCDFDHVQHVDRERNDGVKDWREKRGYVRLLEIDYLTNMVTVNDNQTQELSLHFSLGSCAIHGCIDSLQLFVSTLNSWFSEFQSACSKSDQILRKRRSPLSEDISVANPVEFTHEIDRIRLCDDRDYVDEANDNKVNNALIGNKVIVPSSLLESEFVRLPMVNGDQQEDFTTNTTIFDPAILENYYETEHDQVSHYAKENARDDEEQSTRWIADYDYDDYGFEDQLEIIEPGEDAEDSNPMARSFFRSELLKVASADEESSYDSHDDMSMDSFHEKAAPTNQPFGLSSLLMFSKPAKLEPVEMELMPVEIPPDSIELQPAIEESVVPVTKEVEPGLTKEQIGELENLEKAWDRSLDEVEEEMPRVNKMIGEQQARWYNEREEVNVRAHYIPLVSGAHEDADLRPEVEKKLITKVNVKVKGDFRLKLYEGREWQVEEVQIPLSENETKPKPTQIHKSVKFSEFEHESITDSKGKRHLFKNEPTKAILSKHHPPAKESPTSSKTNNGKLTRETKSTLEITAKAVRLAINMYDEDVPEEDEDEFSDHHEERLDSLPSERIELSIRDFLVSFGNPDGTRRKILGNWLSTSKPRDNSKPMFAMVLLGYRDDLIDSTIPNTEYRLYLNLLPLRCYLTEDFINFIRVMVEISNQVNPTDPNPVPEQPSNSIGTYFQHISIGKTEVKIDYKASHVNIKALQNGDYLQLLNIFPIEGLELTLKALKFNGLAGGNEVGNKVLEAWVTDIYTNQLHRVISGTAPFKGISQIGSDIQGLLTTPYSNKHQGKVVKQIQKSTKSLVTTLAKETLDVSHKITMFLAHTITELASDKKSEPNNEKVQKQPKGFNEGLGRAYDSVSREFKSAAETVIAVPVRQYERSGPSGAFTSVVRALPVAVLRPIAGLAEGISYTILGIRNHLDPDKKFDEEDQWNTEINNT